MAMVLVLVLGVLLACAATCLSFRGPLHPSPHAPQAQAPSIATCSLRASALASSKDDEGIDWQQHWYPIASLTHLEDKTPNKISVLGRDFVVWKDPNIKEVEANPWCVHVDACPHKLAPLSEGVIENGRLVCTYHAWKFDSCGKCVEIPQREGLPTTDRINVATFPTSITGEVLWFWPIAGGQPSYQPHERYTDVDHFGCSLYRELPYRYDFALENLLDPSHVPVAHHGMQGKRSDASPVQILAKNSTADTIWWDVTNKIRGKAATQRWKFTAPCMWSLSPVDNERGGLRIFLAPKDSGSTLAIQLLSKPIGDVLRRIPTPFWHYRLNRFFNSDGLLIRRQQFNALEKSARRPANAYALASTADTMTAEFRQWYSKSFNGVVPTFDPASMDLNILPDRHSIFDTNEQHVKHCKICKLTNKRARSARVAASLVLIVSLIFRRLGHPLITIPAAAVTVGTTWWLDIKMAERDYTHTAEA